MSQPVVSVEDAFEVLRLAVEKELVAAEDVVSEAMRTRSFDAAQQALDRARSLTELRRRVAELEADFSGLAGETIEGDTGRRRLRGGKRTPDFAYNRPILESLVELGGRANLHDVLDRVYAKMQAQLNEFDHAPLPSDGVTPRWRNAAQWARFNMAQQGLLRRDSPRGIWEISDEGRAWLEEN